MNIVRCTHGYHDESYHENYPLVSGLLPSFLFEPFNLFNEVRYLAFDIFYKERLFDIGLH
jgi:hypothetical protein